MAALLGPFRQNWGSTTSEEPSEGDLEYFAKPENYTGSSSILSMQRTVICGKNNNSISNNNLEVCSKRSLDEKIFQRYRDYAFDDEPDGDSIEYSEISVIVPQNGTDLHPEKERERHLARRDSFSCDNIDFMLPRPLTSTGLTRDAFDIDDDSRDTGRLSERARSSIPAFNISHSSSISSLNIRDAKVVS